MKLIVISNPHTINDEPGIINGLFDEGLQLFHLRKPHYSEKELADLLKKIDPRYYSKCVLHQNHHLADHFGIHRIHFPERKRLQATESELKLWKAKGFILSTSIHLLSNYKLLAESFSYTFLGPVFESISKGGYKPHIDKPLHIEENEKMNIKIIAIGGITPEKIQEANRLNFDGVAILGLIWCDIKNAIKNFKECYSIANM